MGASVGRLDVGTAADAAAPPCGALNRVRYAIFDEPIFGAAQMTSMAPLVTPVRAAPKRR